MADVQIDTTARIESVRFQDQTGSVATPSSGYSSVYVKETGSVKSGLHLKRSTGDDVGPFISNETDVYASRPAASNEGNLFLPSDGFVLERDTGAAWASWGPIFPLGGVADAPTTWVNQNDSVATVGGGGVNMYDPVQANDQPNYGFLVKTAPSTPYTITALFLLSPISHVNYTHPLLFGWRDTGDGKLSIFRIWFQSDISMGHLKASSPTADVANYFTLFTNFGNHVWVRIADDGTDLFQYISPNGQNWAQVHTIGRNDYLNSNGPDQVLWGCSSRNTGIPASTTLVSWVEA